MSFDASGFPQARLTLALTRAAVGRVGVERGVRVLAAAFFDDSVQSLQHLDLLCHQAGVSTVVDHESAPKPVMDLKAYEPGRKSSGRSRSHTSGGTRWRGV